MDTCRDTSDTNLWAWHPDRNSIPLRPRRDSLGCWSGRKDVLSERDLFHSKEQSRNRCAGGDRRSRRCRLHPSDRLENAHRRAEDISRRRHPDCNLLELFPTGVLIDKDPSASSELRDPRWPATLALPLWPPGLFLLARRSSNPCYRERALNSRTLREFVRDRRYLTRKAQHSKTSSAQFCIL